MLRVMSWFRASGSRYATALGRALNSGPLFNSADSGTPGGGGESAEAETLARWSHNYLGDRQARFTTHMRFIMADETESIPIYRVLDMAGNVVDGADVPSLDDATLVRMYHTMTTMSAMDKVLYDAQRQGRITFYMTNLGEEAAAVGSAAALRHDDLVFAQYREAGALMWRGHTVDEFMAQCWGNRADGGTKGRQMPVHYGASQLHCVTISSPLGTQMPQAAGGAYALKRAADGRVAVCYFGDGSASEGDAHTALNFAATLRCPIVFFCRNNGYAISTPTTEQYAGDGIAAKGAGYGLNTLRVDGNDVLAVYKAVAHARRLAADNKPVLIEAMTYRIGHHSTSDDSTAYRPAEEVRFWDENDNAIERLRLYMVGRRIWDDEAEEEWRGRVKRQLLACVKRAEGELRRAPDDGVFGDVWHTPPPRLALQREHMRHHVQRHSEQFPMQLYERVR